MKVSLFVTCLVDQLFPQVGVSSLKLLRELGVDVEFDERQTCCGQPAFNSGYCSEARRVARSFLEIYGEKEAIVVPSGSCATMIKHHLVDLFETDSADAEKCRQIASRTYELSDFLVSLQKVSEIPGRFEAKVTFHDSCHQLRELGIREQPRRLIRAKPGVELLEMERSDQCCGFGGTFAVKFDEVSTAMGGDKIGAIERSGAQYVVSNDVSCLMHIDGLLKRRGVPVETLHLAELLVK